MMKTTAHDAKPGRALHRAHAPRGFQRNHSNVMPYQAAKIIPITTTAIITGSFSSGMRCIAAPIRNFFGSALRAIHSAQRRSNDHGDLSGLLGRDCRRTHRRFASLLIAAPTAFATISVTHPTLAKAPDRGCF